jgi:hypothetical protein
VPPRIPREYFLNWPLVESNEIDIEKIFSQLENIGFQIVEITYKTINNWRDI